MPAAETALMCCAVRKATTNSMAVTPAPPWREEQEKTQSRAVLAET
jgi:hypothetical protein